MRVDRDASATLAEVRGRTVVIFPTKASVSEVANVMTSEKNPVATFRLVESFILSGTTLFAMEKTNGSDSPSHRSAVALLRSLPLKTMLPEVAHSWNEVVLPDTGNPSLRSRASVFIFDTVGVMSSFIVAAHLLVVEDERVAA